MLALYVSYQFSNILDTRAYPKDVLLHKKTTNWKHFNTKHFLVPIAFVFILAEYCFFNPCKNGGSCVNGPTSLTCKCAPGFHGKLCEKSEYNTSTVVDAKHQ